MVQGILYFFDRTTYNISYSKTTFVKMSLGDLSDDGTPGHIPNPEVKIVSADGTWGATPWESRSLPRDFFICLTTRQIACIIILLSDAPKFALLTIKKFQLLGGCGKNIHFVKFVFFHLVCYTGCQSVPQPFLFNPTGCNQYP